MDFSGSFIIDWAEIESDLDFTIERLRASMQYITEQAWSGDEQVGKDMGSYLTARYNEMVPKFDLFRTSIRDRVLTVESAESNYNFIISSWDNASDGMTHLLELLPSMYVEYIGIDIRRTRDGLKSDKDRMILNLQE